MIQFTMPRKNMNLPYSIRDNKQIFDGLQFTLNRIYSKQILMKFVAHTLTLMELRGRMRTNTYAKRNPPRAKGAEKGHFFGIFGQKTHKKGLKFSKIFPGRSRDTSKNAINIFY